MKAARKNEKELTQPGIGDHWMQKGKMLEKQGDNLAAIDVYQLQLSKHPHNAWLYDRLLILYRKEKAYKKELALLNTAIQKFTDLFQPGRGKHSKKIAGLSKSILQAVGLTDKKGTALYLPQPIARWQKRVKTLKQRLAAH